MFSISNIEHLDMEEARQFLESSTIHGLYYISTSKKWARIFWIVVSFVGFTGALALITTSFKNWKQSPITTTIETLPISQITFPNVTVCPPRYYSLNLNYDIIQSENRTLDSNSREKLFDYAMEVIQDYYFEEIMNNMSRLQDPNRYFNWYYGYTKLNYPYYDKYSNQFQYRIDTSALSGNISTKYFGESFDISKIDERIYFMLYVAAPKSDNETYMFFNIDRKIIMEYSDADETFIDTFGFMKADLTHYYRNISNPYASQGAYYLYHDRKVSKEDMKYVKYNIMPGLRLTWYYNKEIKPWQKYGKDFLNEQFVR